MSVIKGWKFPIQIDKVSGKIMTVEDNENIKQDVRMIVETQINQRKIVPEFGTDLMSLMFEIADVNFTSMVQGNLEGSLKQWESHIKDLNVSVRTTPGAICNVIINVDYITDISPTQDKFTKNLDTTTP